MSTHQDHRPPSEGPHGPPPSSTGAAQGGTDAWKIEIVDWKAEHDLARSEYEDFRRELSLILMGPPNHHTLRRIQHLLECADEHEH